MRSTVVGMPVDMRLGGWVVRMWSRCRLQWLVRLLDRAFRSRSIEASWVRPAPPFVLLLVPPPRPDRSWPAWPWGTMRAIDAPRTRRRRDSRALSNSRAGGDLTVSKKRFGGAASHVLVCVCSNSAPRLGRSRSQVAGPPAPFDSSGVHPRLIGGCPMRSTPFNQPTLPIHSSPHHRDRSLHRSFKRRREALGHTGTQQLARAAEGVLPCCGHHPHHQPLRPPSGRGPLRPARFERRRALTPSTDRPARRGP